MITRTLAEVIFDTTTMGDCHILVYEESGLRYGHYVMVGATADRAKQFNSTDVEEILEMVLYEPHMGPLDPNKGIEGRRVQLEEAKKLVTIVVDDPSLLEPLRTELRAMNENEGKGGAPES